MNIKIKDGELTMMDANKAGRANGKIYAQNILSQLSGAIREVDGGNAELSTAARIQEAAKEVGLTKEVAEIRRVQKQYIAVMKKLKSKITPGFLPKV